MFGRRTKSRVAGKAARGAGRALLKSRTARTAARGGAKGAIKTARGAGRVALREVGRTKVLQSLPPFPAS